MKSMNMAANGGYVPYRRQDQSYEEPPPPYQEDYEQRTSARDERNRRDHHDGHGGVREQQHRDHRQDYFGSAGEGRHQFSAATPLEKPQIHEQANQVNSCRGYRELREEQNRGQGYNYSGEALEGGHQSSDAPPLERPRTRNKADRGDFPHEYIGVSEQQYRDQGRDYSGTATGRRHYFAGQAPLERPKTSHEKGSVRSRENNWSGAPPLPNQGGNFYDDSFRGRMRTRDERGRENSHNAYSEARQFLGQQRDYPDNTARDGRGRQSPLADLPSSLRPGTSHEIIGRSFQNGYEAPKHPLLSDQQRFYSGDANWDQSTAAAAPRRSKTGHGDRGVTYGGREREPAFPSQERGDSQNPSWEATTPIPYLVEGRSMTYNGREQDPSISNQGLYHSERARWELSSSTTRPKTRDGGNRFPQPDAVLPLQQSYARSNEKEAFVAPPSDLPPTRDADRGEGNYHHNGGTRDFNVSYQALQPTQNSGDNKEVPKPFTMPPPPPTPSDNVDNGTNQFKVARKPLRSYKSSPEVNVWAQDPKGRSIHETQQAWDIQAQRIIKNGTVDVPPLPPRPYLSLKTSIPPRLTESQGFLSPSTASATPANSMYKNPSLSGETLVTTPSTAASSVGLVEPLPLPGYSPSTLETSSKAQGVAEATSPSSSTFTSESKASKFKTGVVSGLKAAAYKANELVRISSNCEKDFSILRHSHALVYYQGNTTKFAISIFASEPLPIDRTLWLQQKGYSGDAGMSVKAYLGRNGDWIHVTPSLCMPVDMLLENKTESGYQRDIAQFKRKASTRVQKLHVLRETCMVRIPASAGNGYFQLLLCKGDKKKLCASPIFRLASLTSTPSSVRGASPLTMPLELALMVGSNSAKAMGMAAVTTAAAPGLAVVTAAQNKLVGKVGGKITKVATSKIVTKVSSKAGEKVTEQVVTKTTEVVKKKAGDWVKDDGKGLTDYNPYFDQVGEGIDIEEGPKEPYPIHFTARNQTAFEYQEENQGSIVTMTLTKTSDTISLRLTGTHIGWCRFTPNEKSQGNVDNDWHETLIMVLPPAPSQITQATISGASKKIFTLQILGDILTSIPENCDVEIYTMGCLFGDNLDLRTAINQGLLPAEAALHFPKPEEAVNFVAVLATDKWTIEAAKQMIQGEQIKGFKRVASNISGVKALAGNQFDKVGGRIGLRMEGDLERDKALGTGGFYVKRD